MTQRKPQALPSSAPSNRGLVLGRDKKGRKRWLRRRGDSAVARVRGEGKRFGQYARGEYGVPPTVAGIRQGLGTAKKGVTRIGQKGYMGDVRRVVGRNAKAAMSGDIATIGNRVQLLAAGAGTARALKNANDRRTGKKKGKKGDGLGRDLGVIAGGVAGGIAGDYGARRIMESRKGIARGAQKNARRGRVIARGYNRKAGAALRGGAQRARDRIGAMTASENKITRSAGRAGMAVGRTGMRAARAVRSGSQRAGGAISRGAKRARTAYQERSKNIRASLSSTRERIGKRTAGTRKKLGDAAKRARRAVRRATIRPRRAFRTRVAKPMRDANVRRQNKYAEGKRMRRASAYNQTFSEKKLTRGIGKARLAVSAGKDRMIGAAGGAIRSGAGAVRKGAAGIRARGFKANAKSLGKFGAIAGTGLALGAAGAYYGKKAGSRVDRAAGRRRRSRR